MHDIGTGRDFVLDQYSDSDKLRIRIETHERYTQGDTNRLVDDAVAALGPKGTVLDVGCGPGTWHTRLSRPGARIVGVDLMAGMLAEAHSSTPFVVQADAQALPFADGSFERVLCAGVLYHVPDCAQALREMRRVLRSDGRAVISTNGAYAMRRIYELHGIAARELGYEPLPIGPGHFTMDDLALVRSVFPNVERHLLEGALVFPTAEPALRFYASNRIDALRDRPPDGSHRARLLPIVHQQIDAIIDREGAFVVPKSVGYFVAAAQ
ncbi:MAG TPA: class I SAM-dependent methyltransferase [Chloroflexota bacterium]|jgi:SAM-dependent methyltransferase